MKPYLRSSNALAFFRRHAEEQNGIKSGQKVAGHISVIEKYAGQDAKSRASLNALFREFPGIREKQGEEKLHLVLELLSRGESLNIPATNMIYAIRQSARLHFGRKSMNEVRCAFYLIIPGILSNDAATEGEIDTVVYKADRFITMNRRMVLDDNGGRCSKLIAETIPWEICGSIDIEDAFLILLGHMVDLEWNTEKQRKTFIETIAVNAEKLKLSFIIDTLKNTLEQWPWLGKKRCSGLRISVNTLIFALKSSVNSIYYENSLVMHSLKYLMNNFPLFYRENYLHTIELFIELSLNAAIAGKNPSPIMKLCRYLIDRHPVLKNKKGVEIITHLIEAAIGQAGIVSYSNMISSTCRILNFLISEERGDNCKRGRMEKSDELIAQAAVSGEIGHLKPLITMAQEDENAPGSSELKEHMCRSIELIEYLLEKIKISRIAHEDHLDYQNGIKDVVEPFIAVLKMFPALREKKNIENLCIIMDLAVKYNEKKYDAWQLVDQIISPLLNDDPSLAKVSGLDRLKKTSDKVRLFLDKNLFPRDIDDLESGPAAYLLRMQELRYIEPDFSSPVDRFLYYFQLVQSSSRRILFSEYTMMLNESMNTIIKPMPDIFSRVTLTGNKIEYVRRDNESLEPVRELQEHVIRMIDDPEITMNRIRNLKQIGKSQKSALALVRISDEKTAKKIAAHIAMQLSKNYQPELACILHDLIIMFSLFHETYLLKEIRESREEACGIAIKQLYEDRLFESCDMVLPDAYFNSILDRIATTGGVVMTDEKRQEFLSSPITGKIAMVRSELKTLNSLIAASKKILSIPQMAENGSLDERSMLIDVKFAIEGRGFGLGLFRGFMESIVPARLEIFAQNDTVKYRLKTGNRIHELRSDGNSLFINDKISADKDNSHHAKAASILDAVNSASALTEKELEQAGKIAHLLNRHILPLLDVTDRKRIKQINRALQFTANTTGDTEELLFVPARDHSMVFRGMIGKDCSMGNTRQLSQPGAYFYKIIQNSIWKGYITLIELENPQGEKALLFDVINVDTNEKVDWLGVFNRFTEYLSGLAVNRKWRYILLPAQYTYISNYDYIRMPIGKAMSGKKRLPKGDFTLRGIEYHDNLKTAKFQSLSGDFIVVWERD